MTTTDLSGMVIPLPLNVVRKRRTKRFVRKVLAIVLEVDHVDLDLELVKIELTITDGWAVSSDPSGTPPHQ